MTESDRLSSIQDSKAQEGRTEKNSYINKRRTCMSTREGHVYILEKDVYINKRRMCIYTREGLVYK